jgi:hypothetical protein
LPESNSKVLGSITCILSHRLRDCTDALHAIERIEHYLCEPDMDPKESKAKNAIPGIKFVNASFSHLYANNIAYLNNLSIDFKPVSFLCSSPPHSRPLNFFSYHAIRLTSCDENSMKTRSSPVNLSALT